MQLYSYSTLYIGHIPYTPSSLITTNTLNNDFFNTLGK